MGSPIAGFQDQCLKPLGHASLSEEANCSQSRDACPCLAAGWALGRLITLLGAHPELGMVGGAVDAKNRVPQQHRHPHENSMQRSTAPPNPDKVKLLQSMLRSWGHDANDFEVEEDRHSELAEMFGLVGGIVIVRRRSTGEERLYATGLGSAWFSSLLMDLARGHFAPAAPSARPQPLAMH